MSNQFSLKINEPCNEDFNKFKPTACGGFCNSCEKEVIDFTKMNHQKINKYFQTTTSENICGRFYNHQLNTTYKTEKSKNRFSLISGLALLLISFFSFTKVSAQQAKNISIDTTDDPSKIQDIINEKEIKVKGYVIDEDGLPLPSATVHLEGTDIIARTDFDGVFEFPEKLKKGDVLIFSYVGYNSRKVVITDKSSNLDVTLNVSMDLTTCVITGEVAVKKIFKSKNNDNN